MSASTDEIPIVADEYPDELLATGRVGYRCWNVRDGELTAPVRFNQPWAPGLNRAGCNGHDHCSSRDPEECSCGLYAVADGSTESYHEHYFELETGRFVRSSCGEIIGAVLLFDVTSRLYTSFIKGRSAVITGLRTPPTGSRCSEDVARALAERYRVPLVSSHAELRETAMAHPLALPRS